MTYYRKVIMPLVCNEMAKRAIMRNSYLTSGQKYAIGQVMDIRHRVHLAEMALEMWRGK